VHEFSHAWAASLYGDDTAARAGRLSLNPLVHLDVLGTILLLAAGFGWAKPVPINQYALERRSRFAISLVSLAGPISNLCLAIVAAIPYRLNLVYYPQSESTIFPTIGEFLIEFIIINLTLAIFNLIPLNPLDGEKVIYPFLPAGIARFMDQIRPYGSIILLAVIMLGRLGSIDVFGAIINPPLTALFRLLMGV
jgi:Zn-dependent protease